MSDNENLVSIEDDLLKDDHVVQDRTSTSYTTGSLIQYEPECQQVSRSYVEFFNGDE